jgi:toxin ParE1/3/4
LTRVIWTRQALDDIEAIRDFIARDSVAYADHLVRRVLTAADRLEQFPMSGRVVPERGLETLREIIHERYRLVYRITDEQVVVITVFHGTRLYRG